VERSEIIAGGGGLAPHFSRLGAGLSLAAMVATPLLVIPESRLHYSRSTHSVRIER